MVGMPETIGSPMLWLGFTAFIVAMLALDLGVLHRDAHEVSVREAFTWSLVWIGLSFAFAGGLHVLAGRAYALQFVTGYLIEKALSVDNVFVFLVVFSFFKVPATLQHRVLFWGIFGALVMRAVFIMAGAALIERFEWIMYIFGALLVFTGYKMLTAGNEEMQPDELMAYRMFRRMVPSTDTYRDGHFFVREDGRLKATPLAAVLVVVESSDLMFAVDSIPAIFAVTRDPFLVYTSNVFAILGLRAMFFLLSGIIDTFAYLKTGLAIVLAYVGVKMLIIEYYHVPPGVSLAVVAGILGVAIAWSLIAPPKHATHKPGER
jgi:tellurite resistance protein TerC